MEAIRRVLRRLLGGNGKLYGLGATLIDFVSAIKKEGLRTWHGTLGRQRFSSSISLPADLMEKWPLIAGTK